MKPILSTLFLLFCLSVARPGIASEPTLVLNLWPGKAPGDVGIAGEERVFQLQVKGKPYEVGGKPTRWLTNVSKPTLMVYRPAKDKDTGLAMLICPGGGYHNLLWDVEGEEVAAWLNSIGVTGIILKYRCPRRPGDVKGVPPLAPLMDAQRAVSLVRGNAKQWGIDPRKIGMVGFSAGGHLAAAAAMNYDRRAYEPIDDIDKISCRPDFAIPLYSGYLVGNDNDLLSAEMRATKETPPILLIHASDDSVSKVENSAILYLALKKAGASAELHIYASGGHGFGVRKVGHPCETWTERCTDWLRKQGFLVSVPGAPQKDNALAPQEANRQPTDAPQRRDGRPNIVVIVADDLGYADVGFQGCKDIPTPHLDALARRGVVCTSGYVTHPFCSPTRAALLTGRYQQRFGHENNPAWLPDDKSVGLPLDQVTLADALKKAGYKTGAVGKWHLGAHPSFHPNRRGFDAYFGLLGGGHQYFDHNQFRTNPKKAKQEYFIPLVRNEKPVEENEYVTDALGREAAAFVESHRKEPFFLYLAFNAPHTPLQAPEKYLARVKDIPDEKRRTYAAMVCGMDEAIGSVMGKLREHKLEQNSLVFFLSDNGGPIAVNASQNTPLRGAKGQVYEGGVRVPFVVSWPAKLKPAVYGFPVSSLDIFPTATGEDGTSSMLPDLDGANLLPHLRGDVREGRWQRTLFWRTGGGDSFAVRKGSMKLVRSGKNPAELYDLAADIGETNNLAEQRPETMAALQKELDAWIATLVGPKWQNPTPAKKKKS